MNDTARAEALARDLSEARRALADAVRRWKAAEAEVERLREMLERARVAA